MPKIINQSDEWDFVVLKERLYRNNGDATDCFATVRQDTGIVLGNVSESRYGILQNRNFVDTIRGALTSVGLADFVEKITAVDDGRRIYAEYTFPKRVYTLPTKVGDKVSMRLQFANSFDTSITAQASLMAEVLRCLNGMILPQKEMSLYSRHDTKISPDFVKKVIESAAKGWENAIGPMQQMIQFAIDDVQGVNVLNKLGFPKRTVEKIQSIWLAPDFTESRDRTLYALYDAITQHLTHEVENNDKAPRLEMAMYRNRQAVMKLAKMVRDSAYYADMIKAIPVEVEVSAEVVE